MKHHLRIVVAVLFLAAFGAQSQAQTLEAAAAQPACGYQFGSGDFVWCVTANGNIVQLTAPRDFEHIAVGNVNEGYALCTPDGGPYFDTGAASAGWADAIVVVDPAEEDGLSITRTTLDGRFTLEQQIIGRKGSRAITIRATVTNNGGAVDNVRLLRTADVDVDNTRGNDIFDRSADSAWARQQHAVSLTALNEHAPHQSRVSANLSPRNCAPAAQPDVPVQGDFAISVRYDLGPFAPGESKAVGFRYAVY